jgi:hypothetical protein
MGQCESKKNYGENQDREESYSPGEQYFNKKVDINPNMSPYSKNSRDKVDLFFTLSDVVNPNVMYSFSITIINNAKLNIDTYLGDLENRSGKYIEFGNTFSVDYYFQREQLLIIEPKINNKNTGNAKRIVLSTLITNLEQKLKIPFNGIGTLIISFKQTKMRETPSQNQTSSFQFTFKLNNQLFNNLERVFFIIYNTSNQSKRPIYKSQEMMANKIMTSNLINLYTDQLSPDGDKNSPIYIGFFIPRLQSNKPVGGAMFYLSNLENNLKNDQLTTISLNSQKYGNLGQIQINYDQSVKLTFIDYLSKGMQINLDIAIDYTASNNENRIPLHNLDSRYPNDYEKAIESCGSIIAFYDYDQLFPVYGFGGIPSANNNFNQQVSHCFNINFKSDPNIKGINNIIKTYRESLKKITLAAPTFFSPVIDKVISEIKYDLQNRREENHYYILLILTDGNINDMNQTRDKIVEASYLPLSIIIVGIGNANFELMDVLDGDKYPLTNTKGELRKRDIVQFVKFEDFKKNNAVDYGTDLTEEVLKEIPTQVEEYYENCGKFY